MMDAIFASPQLADGVLALIAIEAVGLFVWIRTSGRKASTSLWLTLVSGAALVFALRSALADAPPFLIGAALAVALVAHLAYLAAALGGR